jgi:branched-chain amino acid aminotransferase
MWIYLNDRFVPEKQAVVSVFDHGFLYGDGVYETLRSYGNRLFMREQHIARLYRSAQSIGLTIPLSEHQWPLLLREAMARNEVGNEGTDAYLRITITRGPGQIGLDPALCSRPTVVIMAKPLAPPASMLYETGVALIIARTRRNLPGALSPQIKATNFLNNILAKREAVAAGVYDSVLLNWEGRLAECTISNLFFVAGGRLRTPSIDCGILDGITRDVVLKLAEGDGLAVEEGFYSTDDLYEAEECFLTNTSMEIMPAVTVGGRPIGSGKPGAVTRRLRSLFATHRSRFLD